MKGFGEKILNTCDQFTALQLSVMPDEQFAHITVEPTGHINDNIHEDDPGMIEATFQHLKYHHNKERGG